MVYITQDGNIGGSKSIFRLSIFADIFWFIINFIAIFIQTLIAIEDTNPNAGRGKKWGRSEFPKKGNNLGGGKMGTFKDLGDKSKNLPCSPSG